MLLDEFITNVIKTFYLRRYGEWSKEDIENSDLPKRHKDLLNAISARLNGNHRVDAHDIIERTVELCVTLVECFRWQEVVMESEDVPAIADAAVKAQRTNSIRNLNIRAFDKLLDEMNITPTEKTYATDK